MTRLKSFLRRLVNTFAGVPCSVCGTRGASLVVDAVPAGKKVDGKAGVRTRTFTVNSAEWLCAACR